MAACTLAQRSRTPLRVIQQAGMVAQKIAHGGFQPAEAEIVVRVVEHRSREIEGLADSPPSASRSISGPAGYGKPISLPVLSKHSPAASSTVEPSTRCFNSLCDVHEHRVAAADDERDVRLERGEVGGGRIAGDPRRIQMRLVMMNAEKGLSQGERHAPARP